jgi:UTP pyrophosphatase
MELRSPRTHIVLHLRPSSRKAALFKCQAQSALNALKTPCSSSQFARPVSSLPPLKYLSAYPINLVARVRELLEQGKLGEVLTSRYGLAHGIRTDKALYDYVLGLKNQYLRSSEPVSKVIFDPRLRIIGQALGTHTSASRVQGHKLKAKREIRIASLFKEGPEAFLRMIAVHELAHLKIREHDRAFYQLCAHMEPNYHQYEFDLRAYLCHLDAAGPLLWPASSHLPHNNAASPLQD